MIYDNDQKLYSMIMGYIDHGVKADDWKQRGRLGALDEFLKEKVPIGHLQEAVINLASEMAKICKS